MNKLDILSAMTNMGKFTKPQIPENNISQFVFESYNELFGEPKIEAVIIRNILVMQANADPVMAAEKLLRFSVLFESWLAKQERTKEIIPDADKN